MKRIDLHVHSTISDGTLTPTELVHLADKQGLASFALTDHDTIDGITEAKNEAQNLAKEHTSLEVISGVEISAGYKKRDIHLLGLLIDENNTSLIH